MFERRAPGAQARVFDFDLDARFVDHPAHSLLGFHHRRLLLRKELSACLLVFFKNFSARVADCSFVFGGFLLGEIEAGFRGFASAFVAASRCASTFSRGFNSIDFR